VLRLPRRPAILLAKIGLAAFGAVGLCLLILLTGISVLG
jgi:hypothetical protein